MPDLDHCSPCMFCVYHTALDQFPLKPGTREPSMSADKVTRPPSEESDERDYIYSLSLVCICRLWCMYVYIYIYIYILSLLCVSYDTIRDAILTCARIAQLNLPHGTDN